MSDLSPQPKGDLDGNPVGEPLSPDRRPISAEPHPSDEIGCVFARCRLRLADRSEDDYRRFLEEL